jgi:TRAP-type C4-dicarboxylate transport system permease small subunit
MKLILKLDGILCLVLQAIVGILMFWVMGILFLSVIFRYFLNSPIFWADEMATYSLVCITFLGAYLALRRGKMVRVTFIIDLLPKSAVKIISVIANFFVIGLLALIGYQGTQMMQERIVRIQTTVALRIPVYIFYILIPAMAVLMIFGVIIEILTLFVPKTARMPEQIQQRGKPE